MTYVQKVSCYRHPERTTTLECRQCHERACADCRVTRYVGTLPLTYCKSCDAKLRRKDKLRKLGSRAVPAAIILAIGLFVYSQYYAGAGSFDPETGGEDFGMYEEEARGISGEITAVAAVRLAGVRNDDGRDMSGNVLLVELRNTGSKSVPIKPSSEVDAKVALADSSGGMSDEEIEEIEDIEADDIAGLNPGIAEWSFYTSEDSDETVYAAYVPTVDEATAITELARVPNAGFLPPSFDQIEDRDAELDPGDRVEVAIIVIDLESIYRPVAMPGGGDLSYYWYSDPERGLYFDAKLARSAN